MVFNVIRIGQKEPEVILTPRQKAARYIEVKNIIRAGRKMREWVQAVRKRDGSVCQHCGAQNAQEVHHIRGFKTIIVENDLVTPEAALNCAALWDVANGVVLCAECHAKQHPENY